MADAFWGAGQVAVSMLKVLSDLIGDWMNFEQKWLRNILAVVIAVVGHAIAVMRLKSVFLRAKLTLHSLDGRFWLEQPNSAAR